MEQEEHGGEIILIRRRRIGKQKAKQEGKKRGENKN